MQNKDYANFRDEKTEDEVIAVGVPINLPQGHVLPQFQQPLNPYMLNPQQNHNHMPVYAMNQPHVQVNPNLAPAPQ